jgi:hypothetical protein
MNTFEDFIKVKNITPKQYIKGGSASSYFYSFPFKAEFIKVIEDAFELTQKKLKGSPNDANYKLARGFEGITINQDIDDVNDHNS